MVMGGDSNSKGCEFESHHRILDGHFFHLFVVKIVMCVWKDEKMKKRPGLAHFLKKQASLRIGTYLEIATFNI